MNDKPTDAARRTAPRIALAVTRGFADYALIDSGHGRKLERSGAITVDRPEEQAMWAPRLHADACAQADALFVGDSEADDGRWRFKGKQPASWPMRIKGIKRMRVLGNPAHFVSTDNPMRT